MRIFLKRLVFGYIMAFAFTVVMCIIVSIVTDFGEYITVKQQIVIMLGASFKSAFWGCAYPFIMYFTDSSKTRFKKLNSIKEHFGIDYPHEPY